MFKTIKVKNDTGAIVIWCGKEFAIAEEYTIPEESYTLWKNNDIFLTAIGDEDALIGNATAYFTTVSDALNWLKFESNPTDTDQSMIVRVKAAKAGWTYHLCGVELETSVLSSIYHKDADGNDYNEATIKFYDSDDVELTVQGDLDTDCVKTVIDFEPTYDYEIIGGTVKSDVAITTDYRIWVVAVPDLTVAQGGSKVMVDNINLRYIDPNNGVEADGRASKYMTYDATYHTNKLRLVIKHPAGGKEKIMIAYEMYKV